MSVKIKWTLLAALLMLGGCVTPRQTVEPVPHHKVGKPYQIKGRWYYPAADTDYDQTGVASWYGDQFHGRPTANGEIFNMHRLSAAHKTLPLPSLVEVKNLENGRKLVLRVNDRGPFAHDRIIDLSREAAKRLGFHKKGLAEVRVRYVGAAQLNKKAARRVKRNNDMARAGDGRATEAQSDARPVPASDVIADILTGIDAAPAMPVSRDFAMAEDAQLEMAPIVSEEEAVIIAAVETVPGQSGSGGIIDLSQLDAPLTQPAQAPEWFIIRVAALTRLDNIDAMKQALDAIGPLQVSRSENSTGVVYYRINMGPFAGSAEAAKSLEAVRKAGYKDAALVIVTP